MPCFQLIYLSRATVAITPDVILSILTKAQEHNCNHGISGLLVFHQGLFMQLLEGEKDDVTALMEVIRRDKRHTDIHVLHQAMGDHRCMPTWAMGFSIDGDIQQKIRDETFFIPLDTTKKLCEAMNEHIGQHFLGLFAAKVH